MFLLYLFEDCNYHKAEVVLIILFIQFSLCETDYTVHKLQLFEISQCQFLIIHFNQLTTTQKTKTIPTRHGILNLIEKINLQ